MIKINDRVYLAAEAIEQVTAEPSHNGWTCFVRTRGDKKIQAIAGYFDGDGGRERAEARASEIAGRVSDFWKMRAALLSINGE